MAFQHVCLSVSSPCCHDGGDVHRSSPAYPHPICTRGRRYPVFLAFCRSSLPLGTVLFLPSAIQLPLWLSYHIISDHIHPASHAAMPKPKRLLRDNNPKKKSRQPQVQKTILHNPVHLYPCATWLLTKPRADQDRPQRAQMSFLPVCTAQYSPREDSERTSTSTTSEPPGTRGTLETLETLFLGLDIPLTPQPSWRRLRGSRREVEGW